MRLEYKELLSAIEGELTRLLPSEPCDAWFERFFGELPYSARESIRIALNVPAVELVRRGGKRWRPLLLMLAARAFGRGDGALSLAPLVEIAHNGTLIVDDIEDASELRRGQPAIHIMFGIDTAINAGNLLYFLPLALIDEFVMTLPVKLLLYSRYAWHMRRLHLGQAMDIAWHNQGDHIPGEADYLTMCALKTGVLARAAAEFGVLAACGGDSPLSALGGDLAKARETAFALGGIFETVGVAFQIIDDVRNLCEGNPGKARGDDIVEGKKSLPVILACAREPYLVGRLSELFRQARAEGQSSSAVGKAIDCIGNTGAIEEARNKARLMLAESASRVSLMLPSGPDTELLAALIPELEGTVSAFEPGGTVPSTPPTADAYG